MIHYLDRLLKRVVAALNRQAPSEGAHAANVSREGSTPSSVSHFHAPELCAAPVVFLGWQDPCGTRAAPIELWNLTAEIPGHPEGSTLSRETLERAGYWVPVAPTQFGQGQNLGNEPMCVGSQGRVARGCPCSILSQRT